MTHVAYLVSRYPAVSHAFIQREVLALRRAGVGVDTFSLHRADDADVLTDTDRAEREATYAIQPVRWPRLVADHVRAFLHSPARWLATLTHAVRAGRGLRGRVWQAFYFAEAIQLWAEMRRRGLAHVHVHFANPAADVAMLAARFGGDGWRWSLTLHGPAEFFDVPGNRLVEKFSSASFVACASDWARSQAMSLLPSSDWGHLLLIRGGVDTAAWRPAEVRSATGGLRVLNVGRLASVKGQALLIEAIAELERRGVPAHATIVGAGPERAALERKTEELGVGAHVELTGAVGQDRVRELYAWADVFCLPSFREGLPFVAIEALAMELPVVVTRIMGVPELIHDGVNGLLVAPGRVDELADALERLARDDDLRRALGKAGRAKVQRDYELSRLAVELRKAFEAQASAAVSTNR